MTPEGSGRRCERCSTLVHDLSAMTRAEARQLLGRTRGQPICVRYRSGPDGQVLFRSPPARTGGPFVAALAGLLAACTSRVDAVELPSTDDTAWIERSRTTIPRAHGELRGCTETGVAGEIIGGIVGSIHVTMGAMVPRAVAFDDSRPTPVNPKIRDARGNDSPDPKDPPITGRAACRLAKAKRRAERREQRRIRRRARQAERERRRELHEAECELDRQTRRAERKRRRQLRRQLRQAERERRRELRRERRRLRREARRRARAQRRGR